jgi:molecular chaperone GrpE
MAEEKKEKPSNRIPIRFVDSNGSSVDDEPSMEEDDLPDSDEDFDAEMTLSLSQAGTDDQREASGGPDLAELVASRAELKRLQGALAEAQDSLARRQADFDNYRKRIERERGEAHNRIVADVARKLLPVVDNLARALEAERTLEAAESKEFRHFLHGVELINKQLGDVLESLGITQIASVGERFDPHVHEAVVTESSDEYEPDTVTEEITRGYRIGDRLLRPAMVKVAARKQDES